MYVNLFRMCLYIRYKKMLEDGVLAVSISLWSCLCSHEHAPDKQGSTDLFPKYMTLMSRFQVKLDCHLDDTTQVVWRCLSSSSYCFQVHGYHRYLRSNLGVIIPVHQTSSKKKAVMWIRNCHHSVTVKYTLKLDSSIILRHILLKGDSSEQSQTISWLQIRCGVSKKAVASV